MSIQNKRFQSNETQEIVMVTGDSGVFYSLSNGSNIKKDIFFQKYSEVIDASSFFHQQTAAGLSNLTEQLRNIDTNKVQDIGGNIPPAVKYIQEAISEQVEAPPEYREMLLRRHQEEQAHRDLSQYKVYDNEEEAAADFERKQKQQTTKREVRSPRQQMENNPYPQQNESFTTRNEYTETPSNISPPPPQMSYSSADEEAWRFFKSFKRIYPIKLTVDFDEKIAEPMFLKMMANNFEADIINYYTKQIMDRIYNDPGFLENKIYEKLRSIVYDEPQKKPRVPREPKSTTETKNKNVSVSSKKRVSKTDKE